MKNSQFSLIFFNSSSYGRRAMQQDINSIGMLL